MQDVGGKGGGAKCVWIDVGLLKRNHIILGLGYDVFSGIAP